MNAMLCAIRRLTPALRGSGHKVARAVDTQTCVAGKAFLVLRRCRE